MLDFLTSLFTDFTTYDSFIILAFLLGCFLIGLFYGRRSVNKKLKKLQKEFTQQQSELASARAEKDGLARKVKAQEVELQTTSGFLKKTKSQLAQAEQDKSTYHTELQTAQDRLTTLEENNYAYKTRMETLEKESGMSHDIEERLRSQAQELEKESAQLRLQVEQLQTENKNIRIEEENYRTSLLEENKATVEKSTATINRMNMIEAKLERMDQENERLREALSNYKKTTTSNPSASLDISSVHNRLAQLERENQQLQLAIQDLQGEEEDITLEIEEDIIFAEEAPGEEDVVEEIDVNFDEILEEEEEEEEEEQVVEEYNFISTRERSEKARAQLKKVFGDKIPVATKDNKDNLQLINGIGPFIEEQLNTIGIYNFLQISKFDDQTILLVTDAIQFFPGRIKRDDWKGQASNAISNR